MKTLAAIDIGTNSIRLEVVNVEDDGRLFTLTQQKETVRLGEGEFKTSRMTPEAVERGALVCARFAEMARGFGAEEIIAFATSAAREAENQQEFIDRVRDSAGLEVKVISGPEEARLIYLGVVSGADIGDRRGLFMDIGGGSTELILGDAQNHFLMSSSRLGSLRMTSRFLEGARGSVSAEKFARMKQDARAVLSHTTRQMTSYGFDVVYGSAGTITNLAEATLRRRGEAPTSIRNCVVRVVDLQETVEQLCRMTLEERRRVPGLDADRADIIVGGAAVLMTLLESLRIESITISDRGLRHGILVDRLALERPDVSGSRGPAVRLQSVLQLGRFCRFDEEHAHHVTRLALLLFDETRRLGLHPYGPRERSLLHYGALLHDIGRFLSHSSHQRHSHYLIRHSDLLGFNDNEIDIVANIAYYHRKGTPRKGDPQLASIDRAGRQLVRVLSAIVRIAEGLDRSHLALVRSLRLARSERDGVIELTLVSDSDCHLEVWWVEANRDLFERVFGLRLSFRVVQA